MAKKIDTDNMARMQSLKANNRLEVANSKSKALITEADMEER